MANDLSFAEFQEIIFSYLLYRGENVHLLEMSLEVTLNKVTVPRQETMSTAGAGRDTHTHIDGHIPSLVSSTGFTAIDYTRVITADNHNGYITMGSERVREARFCGPHIPARPSPLHQAVYGKRHDGFHELRWSNST